MHEYIAIFDKQFSFCVSMSGEHAYVGWVVLQGTPQQLVASILKIFQKTVIKGTVA